MLKEYFENKKVAFFDLDGTVIQSEIAWEQSFVTILETLNIKWPFPYVPGLSLGEKLNRYLVTEEIELTLTLDELYEHIHKEFLKRLDSIEITDGFWNVVYTLKEELGMKLVLTTNTVRAVTNTILSHFNITQNTFEFSICGDEVKKSKPDPGIYKTALKKLNLKAGDAIAFEDSVAGATASKKAGIDTLVIWDTRFDKEYYPKNIVAFVPNFSVLVGNFTTNYDDAIQATTKEFEENQKGQASTSTN